MNIVFLGGRVVTIVGKAADSRTKRYSPRFSDWEYSSSPPVISRMVRDSHVAPNAVNARDADGNSSELSDTISDQDSPVDPRKVTKNETIRA